MSIDFPFKKKIKIISLGAESAGVFAVYRDGSIFVSENFGDLLDENNFIKYKKEILTYLRKEKIKPDAVLTDLHPLFKTTAFGKELAKKYRVPHIKVQHHISHIFSAVADKLLLQATSYKLQASFYGIAMDGTGYGLDGNVWGGEVFKVKSQKSKVKNARQNSKVNNSNFGIKRIGSLEEQTMIGGDAAVREPARMMIAILAKIPSPKSSAYAKATTDKQIPNKSQFSNSKNQKDFIYKYVRKFYTRNEFELLHNQLNQRFNCQKTTSTGRILDAVSVLLGFAGNERNYKHEAAKKLEENSGISYDIKPIISIDKSNTDELKIQKSKCKMTMQNSKFTLRTTALFEYLIKNIHKDKKRLAATAQLYIVKGLYEIVKLSAISHKPYAIFAAGGLSNNKIFSKYLEKKGVYMSKKIPRGDEGIAAGQIMYYLLNERS